MKFVILGGGTAGYIAALSLKSSFPEYEISVIASKSIGVLGPGEGLTPSFNLLLDAINVSMEDFLAATGGTIKLGIRFIGWNKDKDRKYLETFYNPIEPIGKEKYKNMFLEAVGSEEGLDAINGQAFWGNHGMVSLKNRKDFSYHVDANKMISFFENKSKDLGIHIIDKVVDKVVNDDNENIEYLLFDDGSKINGDFFIDASGFNRLLVGKHYKSEWMSANEYLPTNSAIACTAPIKETPEPYTTALAMDYGWSWKIPLQHRFGCGYVYNNAYINAEQAEAELRKIYGSELVVQGRFTFNSGFYKDVLIKNSLAVGLASSFFEPLEASSLERVLMLISTFIKMLKRAGSVDNIRNGYNSLTRSSHYELLGYIYMHYITNKTNTEFWKNTSKYKTPPHSKNDFLSLNSIHDFMDNFDNIVPRFNGTWKFQAWATIFAENRIGEQDFWVDKNHSEEYNDLVQSIKNDINGYQPHSKYLKNKKQGE